MIKTHYTCSELAKLDLPDYPATRQGWDAIVRKEKWDYSEVRGRGKRGKTRAYKVPESVLKAIHAKVKDQPTSHPIEKMVSEAHTTAPHAPHQASEGANAQFGRRAGDFWNAPLEQFIKVPRFDIHAAAGAGPVIHSEQVVDVCAFKPEWVQHTLGVAPRDIALISVKGDGMAPTLASGDMVLVDTHRGRVEDDAVYVLRHDDGDLRVKRIQRKMDGTLVVMNDNKEYSDDVFSPAEAARLNVVGRVVWRGCRM